MERAEVIDMVINPAANTLPKSLLKAAYDYSPETYIAYFDETKSRGGRPDCNSESIWSVITTLHDLAITRRARILLESRKPRGRKHIFPRFMGNTMYRYLAKISRNAHAIYEAEWGDESGYGKEVDNLGRIIARCINRGNYVQSVKSIDDVRFSEEGISITFNLHKLKEQLRGLSVEYKNGQRVVVSGKKLDDNHFHLALLIPGDGRSYNVEKVYAKIFGNGGTNRYVVCSKTMRGLKASFKKSATKHVTARLMGGK